MESKFTDKLDGVLVHLNDIQSSAISLSEALYFSGFDAEVFTGAANQIAGNIKGTISKLSNLAEEITDDWVRKAAKSANIALLPTWLAEG